LTWAKPVTDTSVQSNAAFANFIIAPLKRSPRPDPGPFANRTLRQGTRQIPNASPEGWNIVPAPTRAVENAPSPQPPGFAMQPDNRPKDLKLFNAETPTSS
jgi:hypothetical protein